MRNSKASTQGTNPFWMKGYSAAAVGIALATLVPDADPATKAYRKNEATMSRQNGGLGHKPPAAQQARIIIHDIEQALEDSGLEWVREDASLSWVLSRADNWKFMLKAASHGLAMSRERDPRVVKNIEATLERKNPILLAAAKDFHQFLFVRHDDQVSDVDLPIRIGSWVIRKVAPLETLSSDKMAAASKVGLFCLGIVSKELN
jgi:hypothetical protein